MKREIICLFFASSMLLAGCGGNNNNNSNNTSTSEERPDKCVVTFDLMYGNKTRVVEVNNGNKVTNYNPKRSGFTLMGWYKETTFKNKYDFDTPVTNHLTLYANWLENAKVVKYDVTFDLNYGTEPDVTVKVIDGQTITATDVPTVNRLGYDLSGWYTTEDCQPGTEFDVEYDVVTGPLTLYAGYDRARELDTDEDGNLVYSGVSFNFAINESFGISNTIKTVTDKFNEENKGKIKVNIVDQASTDNSLITLKLHQTEVINYSGDYHDMQDVLDLAGIEFDESKYYEGQIADSYKNNKLKTYPIGSFVPVVAYNKALMTEYNGSNEIPDTGSEWYSLLEAVQAGEKGNSSWVAAATISTEWEAKEISTHAAYIQNDAPFYVKNSEGKLVNTWMDSAETKADAVNSFKQLRKYFAEDSTVGNSSFASWGKAQAPVGEGNAFVSVLGVPSLYNSCGSTIGKNDSSLSSTIGIAPLSNFFASDATSENADKVLVKSFSLGITDSGPKDLMKKAAAAVFAKYLSENAGELVNSNVYPAHKDVQQEAIKSTSLNWRVKNILANSGNPENFVTYPGHISEYSIFNHYNEDLLPSLLVAGVEDATLEAYVEAMATKINGALA